MLRALIVACALTAFVFGCLITVSAQGGNIVWSRFAPQGDEFTVDVPIELVTEGDAGADASRRYRAVYGGTYMYVFSNPLKKPGSAIYVAGILHDWGRDLNIYAQKPQRLEFYDPYGYAEVILLVRSKTRLYLAQVLSKDKGDEIATRFAATFAVDGKVVPPPQEKPALSRDADTDLPVLTNPAASNARERLPVGEGGGMGMGSGRGVGQGSGSASAPAPDAPKPVVTPLKILNRPRPAYTDVARVYQVAGTVALRVTFLASGQIGSVTPVKTLPFGLTGKAIEAAKQTTFEPARRDSIPINVVKLVEYAFSTF